MDLKQQQIAALPVFVANSSRMLILWDDTYFERLWCNLELATFVHHGGMENVDLVPLWLAPWLLYSILLDFLGTALIELLEHVFPSWSTAWVDGIVEMTESLLGHNPAVLKFVAWFFIWMIAGICYLPGSIPSFFSFRSKLRNHQLLLDQMSAFDVRAAKCSLPADRRAIKEQVTALFGGNDAEMMQTTVDEVQKPKLAENMVQELLVSMKLLKLDVSWCILVLMYIDFHRDSLQVTAGSVKNSQKIHRANQHFPCSHCLWLCRCAFKDSKSRLLWIRQTASMPMWGGPYAPLSYLRLAMNWVCHGTLLFVPPFPWCSTPLSMFWPVTTGHVALQLLWLATHPWLNTWLCKLLRGASSLFWHLPWLVPFFFVWSNLHYHLVMVHYRSLWRFCPVQWPTFTPISVAAWFWALRFAWYRDLTASAWLPDWIWLLILLWFLFQITKWIKTIFCDLAICSLRRHGSGPHQLAYVDQSKNNVQKERRRWPT